MLTLLSVLLAVSRQAPAVPAAAAGASVSHEIEAKVALESSLERRVESVLREILGTQDVLVIVNADMASDAERRSIEIMPGVPPKELSPAAAPLAVAPTLVRRVSATVYLDESTGTPERDLARKTVERLLGAPAASDAVAVETTKFRRAPPIAAAAPDRLAWAVPAAWIAVALAALGLLYGRFLAPLLGLLREVSVSLKDRADSASPAALDGPASAQALPAPGVAGGGPPLLRDGGASGESAHFSFVGERDLAALGFLLSRDPTSAAIVTNYLPPALGARFLEHLPSDVRQQVAPLMSQTRLLNKRQVEMIEEGLRERLQYLMGGESRLADVLETATVKVQRELLASLRDQDPEAAKRLSQRIVMLEDLALLGEADFKVLSRQVTVRSLAAVLASTPALKERILPRLSGGVGEWLLQEIELCGQMSEETIESEQRRVLGALSQAVRDGRIQLRKAATIPADGGEGPAAGRALAESAPEPLRAPNAGMER